MATNVLENIVLVNPLIFRNTFSIKYKIVFGALWFLCLISVIILLAFLVFQVNAEISGRYSIENYKIKISELLKENGSIETSFVNLTSTSNIYSLIKNLNFEKAEKINYIRVQNKQVAPLERPASVL